MIAYVMLYWIAVGVPIVLAARVAGAMLRRHGRAERFVWVAALVLSVVLPMVALVQPSTGGGVSTTAAAPPTGIIGLPTVFVVPDGRAPVPLGTVLLWAWLGVSLLLLVRLGVGVLRLARARRSWRPDTLDGVAVWRTHALGPAVAGIVRPRVLAPEWLMGMPEPQRSLVLLHEQEHIRARDPWLMALSRVAPILAPWNPVIWVLSSRLLRAIELDCDRRVLRHRPDVRAYGSTLIEVSSRDSGRLVAVAAFAESEAPLRSRILSMTTPARTVSVVALLTSMVLGVALILVAFEVPAPAMRAEVAEAPASATDPTPEELARTFGRVRATTGTRESGVDDAIGGPRFTPFTAAPQLLNMDEIRTALVNEYPTVLRDSGIGGQVTIWFFIDEEGQVRQTRIDESSGFQALDEAALNVADVYRFRPALNRDRRVPVWVSLPITFQVR